MGSVPSKRRPILPTEGGGGRGTEGREGEDERGQDVKKITQQSSCANHETQAHDISPEERWKTEVVSSGQASWLPVAPGGAPVPPRPQAGSVAVASRSPDGPCPLALHCCCDICHNNQVAFVCTLHPALVYGSEITGERRGIQNAAADGSASEHPVCVQPASVHRMHVWDALVMGWDVTFGCLMSEDDIKH